jgi:hypothetical protein
MERPPPARDGAQPIQMKLSEFLAGFVFAEFGGFEIRDWDACKSLWNESVEKSPAFASLPESERKPFRSVLEMGISFVLAEMLDLAEGRLQVIPLKTLGSPFGRMFDAERVSAQIRLRRKSLLPELEGFDPAELFIVGGLLEEQTAHASAEDLLQASLVIQKAFEWSLVDFLKSPRSKILDEIVLALIAAIRGQVTGQPLEITNDEPGKDEPLIFGLLRRQLAFKYASSESFRCFGHFLNPTAFDFDACGAEYFIKLRNVSTPVALNIAGYCWLHAGTEKFQQRFTPAQLRRVYLNEGALAVALAMMLLAVYESLLRDYGEAFVAIVAKADLRGQMEESSVLLAEALPRPSELRSLDPAPWERPLVIEEATRRWPRLQEEGDFLSNIWWLKKLDVPFVLFGLPPRVLRLPVCIVRCVLHLPLSLARLVLQALADREPRGKTFRLILARELGDHEYSEE